MSKLRAIRKFLEGNAERTARLNNFLKQDDAIHVNLAPTNKWFHTNLWSVYLRCGWRTLNNEPYQVPTLEVANINVVTPGQGYFTKQIGRLEKLALEFNRVLYVENVFAERFVAFFKRRGYVALANTAMGSTCLYWLESRTQLPDSALRDAYTPNQRKRDELTGTTGTEV